MKEQIQDLLQVKKLGEELVDLFEFVKRKYRLPKKVIDRCQNRVKAAVDEISLGPHKGERREIERDDVVRMVDKVRNLQTGTPVLVFQLLEDRSGIVEQCSGDVYRFKAQ